MTSTPPLAGVHHLKLPVSDLDRSRRWYESVLGLRVHTVHDAVLFLHGPDGHEIRLFSPAH